MPTRTWAKWDELAHDEFTNEIIKDGYTMDDFVEKEL